MNKKNDSLKLNLILNTIFQILTMFAPILTAPYVSRVLGVEQIGKFSYFYSINYYFILLAGLGTATYGIIEIAKNRDDKIKYSNAFWGIEIITIISSLVSIFIWLGMLLIYQQYSKMLSIMILYLVAVLFDISWFYIGIEKVKYSVIVNTFFKITGVILIFVMIKSPGDLNLYILILCGSTLLGNLSMWFFLPIYVSSIKISKKELLYYFRGTLVYFIPTIATSISAVLDKTLIGLITKSDSENGYYEQSTKIITLVRAVCFASLNNVLSARMAYLYKNNGVDDIERKKSFSINIVMILGVSSCFGIIAISNFFVPIFFGDGYDKVIYFMMLMAPLIPLMGISNTIGSLYYNPSGNRKKSAILLLICAAINLVLSSILIVFYWGYGAIIATLISELILLFLYIYYSKRFISFKEIIITGWKKLIAGLTMFFVLFFIKGYFNITLLNLLILIIIGIAVYFFVLLLLFDDFIIQLIKKICSYFKKNKNKENQGE